MPLYIASTEGQLVLGLVNNALKNHVVSKMGKSIGWIYIITLSVSLQIVYDYWLIVKD